MILTTLATVLATTIRFPLEVQSLTTLLHLGHTLHWPEGIAFSAERHTLRSIANPECYSHRSYLSFARGRVTTASRRRPPAPKRRYATAAGDFGGPRAPSAGARKDAQLAEA